MQTGRRRLAKARVDSSFIERDGAGNTFNVIYIWKKVHQTTTIAQGEENTNVYLCSLPWVLLILLICLLPAKLFVCAKYYSFFRIFATTGWTRHKSAAMFPGKKNDDLDNHKEKTNSCLYSVVTFNTIKQIYGVLTIIYLNGKVNCSVLWRPDQLIRNIINTSI